jgi:hypothetical protein
MNEKMDGWIYTIIEHDGQHDEER